MPSELCGDAGLIYNYPTNCGKAGHQHFENGVKICAEDAASGAKTSLLRSLRGCRSVSVQI